MKKIILIIGIVVLSFFAYTNFSSMNAHKDYVESCLYISTTRNLKDECYKVYPEDYDRNSLIFGILSTLGALMLLAIYSIDKKISRSETSFKSKVQ